MKCKISGTWLSVLDFNENGACDEIDFGTEEVDAIFTNGLFAARVNGTIDDHLLPYWGKSIVKP